MSKSDGSLKDLVRREMQGKQIPAISILNNGSNLAALASKLIEEPIHKKTGGNAREKMEQTINRGEIEKIFKHISENSRNNRNIFKLFPDVEMAAQIIISSILSPKDMTSDQLLYSFTDNLLPSDLAPEILDLIKNTFEKHYKIRELLPTIIRETLFEKGSYAIAVLPESSIDDVVNSDIALENFIKNNTALAEKRGWLSTIDVPRAKDVIETGLGIEPVVIMDNYDVLKLPAIRNRAKKNVVYATIRNKDTYSLESLSINQIFRDKTSTYKQLEIIANKSSARRKTIGRPLTLRINSEAVVPVFIPGDPGNHRGYLIIIDETGNPIASLDEYSVNGSVSSQSMPTAVSQKAVNNLTNMVNINANMTPNSIFSTYRNLVEQDIYNKISNGVSGGEVSISGQNDVYRVMFARALSGQRTSLLFIPSELIVYFAIDHYDNGVGKSLLDDLSVLTSLRAVTLFSRVISHAKNAIAMTRVNVTLDPDDPDPDKTTELVIGNTLKTMQSYLPFGLNNPADLVDWVQRAGVQFSFENNPNLPNVKLEYENVELNHTLPSDDLDQMLQKQTIMGLSVPPELIDSTNSPEFATTVVTNNLLLSKSIAQKQTSLEFGLKKFITTINMNDATLRSQITDILKEKIGALDPILSDEEKQKLKEDQSGFLEYFLDKIADNILVTFPRPDNTNLTNLSETFAVYEGAVDKMLESWMTTDTLPESVAGKLSSHAESFKSMFKAYLLREWAAKNNYLPEMADILDNTVEGENGNPASTAITKHVINLVTTLTKMLEGLQPAKAAVDQDLDDLGIGEGESPSGSDIYDDSSESGGDGLDGFSMDMGSDLDMGAYSDDLTGDTGDNLEPPKAEPTDDVSDVEKES